jgi:CubicO group peptidase (beta-lactamase class C family)
MIPSRTRSLALVPVLVLVLGSLPAPLRSQTTDRARLVSALDSAARAYVAGDAIPGVSVAVVRGADTLLMTGYGVADIEWQVPTPADASASYEIGSMTKQFTATAVLQLVAQGKLDLDADVTRYLPGFDTQGHQVPVRRLLDHTSGIKGYTEMPVFGEIMRDKLPRDSLVTLIGEAPFDFEPGTAQIYNNSAYFLLGLIIEKVSGRSYADYVKEHIFDPLGMTSSYYCSESDIHPGHAHGYDTGRDGLHLKGYLDHTWPFAAGSLCSTARDLITWNLALHHGGVLPPAAYAALTTPRPLNDGTPIRYAMGLQVDSLDGRKVITHGGGINGFLSDGRYYPQADLTVIVLQNSTGQPGPARLGLTLANLVLGPPPGPRLTPFTGSLDELVGAYEGPGRGSALRVTVTREGDGLLMTPEHGPPTRPKHLDGLRWVDGGTIIGFMRGGAGIDALYVDQGGGHYVLKRTGR